ncbi:SUMF1/EgtB/PvdO family nonheme iron enzyme [Capilliphycus salinus ALCB114379]|uniref:SUMF1/EgtB/PvdO family nonheme iron enzyme n=1 Tax=Capilliphycus salinus TaxID=2768948 RepID=UPI0039A507D3
MSLDHFKNSVQKLLTVLGIFILAVAIFSPSALAASSPTCPENMVFISGGEFKMGSDQPEFLEELPVEDVSISSFCIDPYEITVAKRLGMDG